MPDKLQPTPGWWQTLPGILTGIAAIITAVTGLVLAYNSLSHSGSRIEELKAKNSTSTGETNPVPAGTREVVLQISSGDEKSRIPFKLP